MFLAELSDGTSVGITGNSRNIDFDLGDGLVAYDAGTGILMSNLAASCGLEADNYEVRGPITDTAPFRLEDFLGGRWNYARTYRFQVNYKSLSDGAIKQLAGNVTEARIEGGKFILEVRSDVDRYNQTVGRVITDQCDADFADQIQCFATTTTVVGTVTAVTDAMRFTVSFTGSYANDFFNKGTVEFLTGVLAGTDKIEIEDWTSAGAITLFAPAVESPAIGDTMTVRDGCGKSRADCIAHNAIEWFRGYPEVPGRRALMPAIPGQ
jgi:uncharacterized phage protein (TIGR02218 family)